jgi:hypothetical protein
MLAPTAVYGADLVPCGDASWEDCQICQLQVLAMNIMELFVVLVVILAAILFVNAGVLYVLSPSNISNISKAHKLFFNTLVGLIIVLVAWMVISFIMGGLLNDGYVADWTNALCS